MLAELQSLYAQMFGRTLQLEPDFQLLLARLREGQVDPILVAEWEPSDFQALVLKEEREGRLVFYNSHQPCQAPVGSVLTHSGPIRRAEPDSLESVDSIEFEAWLQGVQHCGLIDSAKP